MATAAATYLDPQTLASISTLQLRARMIVEGLMTGMHRSPFQGFSIEFAQHRQYTPGDDIRHLDWKIFGRTDKLYLKQYHQETNLDLQLLVDVSGSMGYSSLSSAKGTPAWRKFDHAASLAAAMAYLAVTQQDRVGLTLFTLRTRVATRTSNSHDHWRGVCEALSAVKLSAEPVENESPEAIAQRATDLGRVFDEVLARLTHRSIIVLISDLLDDPAVLESALARVHHRRHDLILLQTLDPAERDFPFRGPSEFVGLEGEARIPLDPEALRQGYLEAFNRHQTKVEEMARRFRFDHLQLDTSQSLGPPMSHFIARRAAMINQGH